MQVNYLLLRRRLFHFVSTFFATAIIAITCEVIVNPNYAWAYASQKDDYNLLVKERDQLLLKVKLETADAKDIKRLAEIDQLLSAKLELSSDVSKPVISDIASEPIIEDPKH